MVGDDAAVWMGWSEVDLAVAVTGPAAELSVVVPQEGRGAAVTLEAEMAVGTV